MKKKQFLKLTHKPRRFKKLKALQKR